MTFLVGYIRFMFRHPSVLIITGLFVGMFIAWFESFINWLAPLWGG